MTDIVEIKQIVKKLGINTLKGFWYVWVQYCIAEIIYLCICWVTSIVTGGTLREANLMYSGLFWALSTWEAAMTIPLYTLLYFWFSTFVSWEKHKKLYIIPYLVYAALIYPVFNDWEITCYLTPLYGLIFYISRKWIIKILSNKPMLLKITSVTFNVIMILIPVYYILAPLPVK